MKLKKSLIYSFVATAATLQYTANAVDIVWNGSTSQDLNVGSNWNGGIVPPGAGAPTDGDAVVNISTGNYPVVTAGESFANRDWKIGMEASNVGRVDHNGGTISTANGSWFFLGTNGGTGTYNLADAAGSGGTYTAMGQGAGSITAGNFYVGIGGYPWDQSNAPARAGNGTLRVNTTGSITATGETFVGLASTGVVHHDSGTFTSAGTFRIAENPGGNGTYNFSGGTISVTGGEFWIGQNTATGLMTMTGGTLSVNNWVAIGRDNGTGTMNMSGGTFNKTGGGNFIVGASGPGTMAISGSSLVNVTGGITWIGENGNGTLSLTDTAEFRTSQFVLAAGGGGVGTANLNGGTLKTALIDGGNGAANVNFNGTQIIATATALPFISDLDTAVIDAGGLKIDTVGFNLASAQVFTGTGSLTKTGSGSLTLSGASTYSGATALNAGTLTVSTRATGAGALTAADGTTLRVAVAVYDQQFAADSVTLGTSAATTLAFDLNTFGNPSFAGAPLKCNNALTFNGPTTIQVTGSNLAIGQFPLISYGSKTGSGSFVLGTLPPGVSATLVDTGTSIDLNITSVASLEWEGTVAGEIWDINTTANWYDAIALSTGAKYINGALVTFNNTATGYAPVLNTTVSPSAVVFDNTTNYVLSGTGAIAGTGTLTKRSAGAITLDLANTYTGATVIESGVLNINTLPNGGVAGPIGSSTNSASNFVLGKLGNTTANGATLNYTGASAVTDRGITLYGTGLLVNTANDLTIGGDVASIGSHLIKSGAGKLTFSTPNDFTLASSTPTGDFSALRVDEGTLAFSGSGTQDASVNNNEMVIGSDGVHAAHLLIENARLSVGNWISVSRGNGTTGLHSTVTVNNGGIICNDYAMCHVAGVAGYNALATTTLNDSTLVTGRSQIGEDVGGNAVLNINGTSTYTSNQRMLIGINAGAIGSVKVSNSGVLNVAGWFAIGNSGTGSLTVENSAVVNAPADFNIADLANGNGTVTLKDSAVINAGAAYVGKGANSTGVANIDGGTFNSANTYVGNSTGSVGTVLQTGGATVMGGNGEVFIGANGAGTYTLSGGTMSTSGWLAMGRYLTGVGVLNVSGGTLTQTSTDRNFMVAEEGNGTLNVSGSGVVDARGFFSIGQAATGTGVVNLNGGKLMVNQVDSGNTASNSTFRFNGGELEAKRNEVNFFRNIDTAEILSGGAFIDSNGFDIVAAQTIQGTGDLTKLGAGKLTLTAANAYTGDTLVNAGTLSLAADSLADASEVVIASGATLDLTHSATDVVADLTINGVAQADGIYGAVGSGAPNETAAITGTGRLQVGATPYGTWAAAAGLTSGNNAVTADPDNDGVVNLLEYYLNDNPLGSSSSALPVASAAGANLVLTFKRRDDANGDVSVQKVQYGSNLDNDWTDVAVPAASGTVSGVTFTIVDNGTAPDDVTVSIPKGANPKLFARVVITE